MIAFLLLCILLVLMFGASVVVGFFKIFALAVLFFIACLVVFIIGVHILTKIKTKLRQRKKRKAFLKSRNKFQEKFKI